MLALIKDLVWAWHMIRAKRYRSKVLFERRARFDGMLRPRVSQPYPDEREVIMAYPDAIYHTTPKDFRRAYNS
jgi:hypothetical protein